MDNKKKDDDIIELTEEELDEILTDEDFEGDDGCEEVHSLPRPAYSHRNREQGCV